MRAEYTLAQAVAMVNLVAEQWHAHFCSDCERCVEAEMWREENPGLSYCDYGQRLKDLRAKWKRRCKAAARREGTPITV
jgi:hypothetical protein